MYFSNVKDIYFFNFLVTNDLSFKIKALLPKKKKSISFNQGIRWKLRRPKVLTIKKYFIYR